MPATSATEEGTNAALTNAPSDGRELYERPRYPGAPTLHASPAARSTTASGRDRHRWIRIWGDAVDDLVRLLDDEPKIALLRAQEHVNVLLRATNGIRQVHQLQGLHQIELAARLA